jgi:hypothetical protein
MKKIAIYMMTMVFTLALGLAYAGEHVNNGVTDFTGRSYETLELNPAIAVNSFESSGAGSLRAGDYMAANGVTDFSGRSYDSFEIGPSAAGGGLRKGQEVNKASHEGVGTSPTYDTTPIVRKF